MQFYKIYLIQKKKQRLKKTHQDIQQSMESAYEPFEDGSNSSEGPTLSIVKTKRGADEKIPGSQQNWNQFREYVRREITNIFSNKTYEGAGNYEEQSEVDHELEQLINMTRIPFQLERFMIWTLLACLDCFLHYFTVMPIRVIHGVIFKFKKGRMHNLSSSHKERTMAFVIIVACIILSELDTSKAYHRIKRQSSVKLYMLFGVLEMADKMLASMGQSLLSVLSRNDTNRLLLQKTLLLGMSIIYLVSHGYVMVYQTVALNVAVNSYSNALITLLLSLQFAEIKASLFKRMDKEGLFQLTIADLVERSQLILLLIIIALRNVVAKCKSQSALVPNSWTLNASSSVIIGVLCGPMFTVLGSELIVDWVKHAYVTKFNRIRPQIYSKFLFILCEDHSISLHKFRDRLGLPVPALVLLFIVMMRPTLGQTLDTSSTMSIAQSVLILTLAFICLMIFKITLHIIVIRWGQDIRFRSHKNISVTEAEYVPGDIAGGSAKIDYRARSIIHKEKEVNNPHKSRSNITRFVSPPTTPTHSKNSTLGKAQESPPGPPTEADLPLSLNDLRKKKNSKNPHSLENVARYKMVSKRIW